MVLPGRERAPGWRYVIMTRTVTGEILAVGGPEGGRSNDLTLTNAWDSVLGLLVPNELVLADRMWRCNSISIYHQIDSPKWLLTNVLRIVDGRFLTPGHTLVDYDDDDIKIRSRNSLLRCLGE
jgi:hypothetical protein